MTLFTNNVLNFLKRGITFGEVTRSHPFTWDHKINEPKTLHKPLQLFLWYGNVIITFLYYGFVVFRCITINMSKEYLPSLKIYMRFPLVYYLFPSIFQITFMLKKDDFPEFSRQYLALDRIVGTRYELRGTFSTVMKICEYFMIFIYYGFILLSCLITLLAFFRPDSPEFISSVLSNPYELSLLSRILFALFQAFYEYNYIANAYLCIFNNQAFISLVIIILREVGSWERSKFISRKNEIVFLYRNLQISLSFFKELSSSFLLPVSKAILISFAIFCLYGAVRLPNLFMRLTLAVIGITTSCALAGMLLFMAEIHVQSSKLLRALHSLALLDGNRFAKSLNSMPVLKVKIRSAYAVDKPTVLTMFKIVFDSSVNFLMANPV